MWFFKFYLQFPSFFTYMDVICSERMYIHLFHNRNVCFPQHIPTRIKRERKREKQVNIEPDQRKVLI